MVTQQAARAAAQEDLCSLRPLRIERLKQMLTRVVRSWKLRRRLRSLVALVMQSSVRELHQCRTRNCVLKEFELCEAQFVKELQQLLQVPLQIGRAAAECARTRDRGL